MALKERYIDTNYLPPEGKVELQEYKDSTDSHLQIVQKRLDTQKKYLRGCLEKALDNYTLSGMPVYAPDLEKQRKTGRIISYSYALCALYNTLTNLKKKIKPSAAADDDFEEHKRMENKFITAALDGIKKILPEIGNAEYPEAEIKISDDRVQMQMKDNPQDFVITPASAGELEKICENLTELEDYVAVKSPNFQAKALSGIREHHAYLNDKMSGLTVRQKPKTAADKIDDIKESVEFLIADDTRTPHKVDRKKAEQTLATKLDAVGLQLEVVYVDEKKSPQEELLNQAKTCVMRAVWDGFISSDGTSHCSEVYKSVWNHPEARKNYDISEYHLENSPVWQICQQVSEFNEQKASLLKGLQEVGFPPEKLAELSYEDIAYTLCAQHPLSSKEIAQLHSSGLKPSFATKIPGRREEFYKSYIRRHEKELRTLLTAQGKTGKYINEVVDSLKKGKGHPDFDGHHAYNLSDPETYEKITGKKWYTMDNPENIIFMDKNSHFVIHSTENNINGAGRMIMDDAKSSHRTIFKDKASGRSYYYVVRPKEGINTLAGLDNEMIFNKDFLEKFALQLNLEKENIVQKEAGHARELITRYSEKRPQQETPSAPQEQTSPRFSGNDLQRVRQKAAEKTQNPQTMNNPAAKHFRPRGTLADRRSNGGNKSSGR